MNSNPNKNIDSEYKVLNQLIAAQSMLHVFPNDEKLGKFIAQALIDIPAIEECAICLRTCSCVKDMPESEFSTITETLKNIPDNQDHFSISIPKKENRYIFSIKTVERSFGYLFLSAKNYGGFKIFKPAINNFINMVALDLENRWQKKQLINHKLHFEELVENRTAELKLEIAEHKKTEETLKSSEERLKIIFESAPDAYYMSDLKGVFLDGNKAAEELIGHKKEDLIGTNIFNLKLISGNQFTKITKAITKSILGKKSGPYEFILNHKDGHKISVEITTFPVKIKNKTVILGIARDISERRKAKYALEEQRQKLADILEGTNAGTWEWNVQTSELIVDKRWADIMGKTLDELKPFNLDTWINNVHPDDLPGANALLDKHFNRELDYYDVEFRQPHKHGNWVWVNARGKVIEWTEDGKPLRMSGTHLDITQRKKVEDELIKLSTAVKQSPSVIVITDLNGIIEYVNPRFTDLTGYTSNEAIGQNLNILNPGEQPDKHYKELWEIISSGKKWRGEFHNKKKNGELFWEAASISPIIDKQGKIINYLKVARDVTEAKQTEELLRDNEEQYRAVVENSHNGISIIGEAYKLDYMNDKLCEIFGRKHEEIIGHDFREFLDEESKKFMEDMYLRRQKGEEVQSMYEFNAVRKEGEKRRVEISSVVVEDSKGRKRTIAQLLDITERKKAELELMQSEQRFKSLFEDLGDAVFVTTVGGINAGRILEVNSAATKQTGYTKDELLQMNIVGDLLVPSSGKIHHNEWDEMLQKGETVTTTEQKRRKDGTEFWTEVIVTPIEFKGKKASLSINHDITNRIQAEIDLKAALKKATESDRLKSAFLATMSHELRTPLNAIIGFSGLIDRSLPLDDIIKYCEIINSSGENLLSIVKDLFDISLIESGEVKIIKEEVVLQSVLNNVHEVIKAKQHRDNKDNIELNMITPVKNSELTVFTDETKLSQVLINLLKNALKFTKEGHINYGYNIETKQGKPILKFHVEDTGIGIPKKKQEVIFEIFRQVEDSLSREYGGTGIGLSISKKLIKLLGGKIWVESEVGIGSTFYFTIPLNEFIKIDPQTNDVVENKKSIEEKTILIAEDDVLSFKYLESVLNSLNINTIWAKNGKESVTLCKENTNINLILMDINMPVMDGYEATKKIKQFRPELPIIAQTAHAIAGDREKALDAGCDDYISKPIKKEVLLEMINHHMNEKKHFKTKS